MIVAAGKARHMNFWKVLRAHSGKALVRRWSDEEIRARKAELEARLMGGSADVASSMEVAEYLVQRYLPRDPPLTQARWRRIQAKWQSRLAEGEAKGLLTPDALEAER